MMVRPWLVVLNLSIFWLILEQSATAVVVFERGKTQPTIGRLVRQDERSVVIELEEPGGRVITREIPRSEIEDLLIVVSEERLSALRPEDPAAYRDYAEELAAKRKDPDARLASLRLYLIAAHLDPDTLGHSSLLGMIALARNPTEERRFRAMAFLLDPNHDRRVLTSTKRGAAVGDDAGRAGLLKAIQAMRRGQRRLALQWADREPVQKEFEKYQDLIGLDQFQSLETEIPPQMLRRLLTLEWILTRDGDEGESPLIDRRTSWSQTVERRELDPVAPLHLETLTEFDPRESIYDQGRWMRPAGRF
jgi:hypothetical protein